METAQSDTHTYHRRTAGRPSEALDWEDGQDVLRNGEGTAIIGDPRNDSHVLMSQMHLAFVRAHNRFVDRVRSEGAQSPRCSIVPPASCVGTIKLWTTRVSSAPRRN